uniref:Large ribosomal subunit protein bL25 n=1 Tax=candidate division WOR-3 bacterium TaxID=2052148 RepID=A0A7C4GG63_UNCW3
MPYVIKATQRPQTGKNYARRLRRSGTLPAVMYGHGDPSLLLALPAHDFARFIEEIKGHSPIVDVEIDGQPAIKCVIKTIQRNPIDRSFLHVDFQKVHARERITMRVPVVVEGTPEGVKAGGMLEQILHDIEVRATIEKIPERFSVDVTGLKLGQSFHVADLKVEDVEILLPPESAIATVLTPRKLQAAVEAATTPAAEAPTQPEVITEKKPAEEETDEEEKGKAKGKEKGTSEKKE